MSIRPITRVEPGGQLSARELNRAFSEIERASTLTATAPVQVHRSATGYHIFYDGFYRFPAKITGRYGNAYAFVEQQLIAPGYYVDMPPNTGRRGGVAGGNLVTPAYEDNGNTGVPVGTVVWMERGYV